MEKKSSESPLKAINIELTTFNDLINPKNLLNEIAINAILEYLEQGVPVHIIFEDQIVQKLSVEDFK